jgi:poly(hydroxyalkanoate) depolymerase family esterase
MRKTMIELLIFINFFFGNSQAQSEGVYQAVSEFGDNPGELKMYQYVPANIEKKAGLVVVLHGCGMSAKGMKEGMGWNALAEKYQFLVVYGEQQRQNNKLGCFNFFVTEETTRESGEVLSIKRMVDFMKAHHPVDDNRVFVTGFSAGGAMTLALLATYPDIFNKGATIGAAMPYRAATLSNQPEGFSGKLPAKVSHLMRRHLFNSETRQYDRLVANDPVDKVTPEEWGSLVTQAYPSAKHYPTVMLIHGVDTDGKLEPYPKDYDGDKTVHQYNLRDAVKQWTNVHDADQLADIIEEGFAGNPRLVHKVYQSDTAKADHQTVVETLEIKGLDHFIPVDPGTEPYQGGIANKTAPHYSEDVDFYAAYWIAKFFGLIK